MRSALHVRFAAVGAIAGMVALGLASLATAASDPSGRWDATLVGHGGRWPAWFELTAVPGGGFVVDFVGSSGGVGRAGNVSWDGRTLAFDTPSGSDGGGDARLVGSWNGRFFRGHVLGSPEITWTAVRQPAESSRRPAGRASPVALFDGRTLAGWRPRWTGPRSDFGWTVDQNALMALGGMNDVVSSRSFGDFELHLEYRLAEGADSGVHLRGRYEIQLTTDDAVREAAGKSGGIYSRIAPAAVAQHPAGEWNTLDVTLIGRHVTVVLNGVTTVDRAEIAGITGDALDSDEGRPGPIMLQGHLGRVWFRNVTVTPAR